MKNTTLVDLLRAGVHFGHKSSRWHPAMKPYIYGHRNNIHIFNLEKTQEKLQQALQKVADVIQSDGKVLFVGTKKQAQETVKAAAEECNMPYVTERWLGGTFTNFKTIQKSIKKLDQLKRLQDSDEIEAYTKKERLLMSREITKLERLFAGIADMKSLPQLLIVFSAKHDIIAIREANKMNIPVIAVVDSNTNPENVDYVVPGNDDSKQAIELYAKTFSQAVNDARSANKTAAASSAKIEKEAVKTT